MAATWVSATSGDWTDPTKWSTNPSLPPAMEPITISAIGAAYTVNVNDARTVGSFSLLSGDATLQTNGNLRIGSQFIYTGGNIIGNVMFLESAAPRQLRFDGQAAGSGTFIFQGSGSISQIIGSPGGPAASSVPTGVTVIVRATGAVPSNVLNLAGGASNNGTITLETVPNGPTTSTTLSLGGSGTYTNNGQLNFNEGGLPPLTATRTISTSSGVSLMNAATGTMNVNATTNVQVGFTNVGTINVAAGKTLSAGTMTHSGGSLNISGALEESGDFHYTGGSITGTVKFTGLGTQSLYMGSQGPATGNFLFTNTAQVQGTIRSGMAVTLQSSQLSSVPTLTVFGGASNAGTLTFETTPTVASSTMTLTMAGTGNWSNDGTLNFNGGGTVGASLLRTVQSFSGVYLNNTGTINVNSNTSFQTGVRNGVTVGGQTFAGTINVAAGSTLSASTMTLTAGTLNIDGTYLNSGDFVYNGGSVDGTVQFTNLSTQRLIMGSQASATGNFLLTSSGEIQGSIRGGMNVTLQSSQGSSIPTLAVFTGSSNDGTLTFETTPTVSSSTMTLNISGPGIWTNNGTLNFNGGGTVGASLLRTVQSFSGANLANTGTINVNSTTTFQRPVRNTGTINVAAGKTLSAGMMTLAAGALNIDGTYLNSEDFVYEGGSVTGTVRFSNLSTQRLIMGSQASATGNFLLTSSGEIQGSIRSGMNVTLQSSQSSSIPTLAVFTGNSNDGTLTFETTPTVSSSTMTLNMNGPGTWTNNGTLNFNGGGTVGASLLRSVQSFSGATLANTGTINVNSTTSFQRPVRNTGSINVAAGNTLSAGMMTLAAGTLNIGGTYLNAEDFVYEGGSVIGTVRFSNLSTQRLIMGSQASATGNFLLTSSGEIQGSIREDMNVTLQSSQASSIPSLNVFGGMTNNGTLTFETTPTVTSSTMSLNLNGVGTWTNAGTLNLNGGGTVGASLLRTVQSFSNVSLTNSGTINVNSTTSFQASVHNAGTINVAAGKTLSAGMMTLAAGTLNVDGTYLHSGDFAYTGGAVNGTVQLTNLSTQRLIMGSQGTATGNFLFTGSGEIQGAIRSGMNVTLQSTQANTSPTLNVMAGTGNAGTLTFQTTPTVSSSTMNLNVNGPGVWTNAGTINFNGGGTVGASLLRTVQSFSGAGFVNTGVVNVNAMTSITAPFQNQGTVNVSPGQTLSAGTLTHSAGSLNVSGTMVAAGDITYLGGAVNGTVNFSGGVTRTLTVGNPASGSGTFAFTGAGSVMAAPSGGHIAPGVTVRSTAGATNNTLAIGPGVANRGTITLDAASDASASSVGMLAVDLGGLSNYGTINFNAGAAAGQNLRHINGGTLTNEVGGTINFNAGTTVVFNNDVVNNGTFKNTEAHVIFNGTHTLNGAYHSDPAVNEFVNLVINPSGYLKGEQGDIFVVSGDFTNASNRKDQWDTTQAELKFTAGAEHTVTVIGHGEFGFGTIRVEAGATITLQDGDSTAGGGIYADTLILPTISEGPNAGQVDVSVLQVSPEAPVALVLNPDNPANAEIVEAINESDTGLTAELGYAPEPASLGLIMLAGGGLLSRRRRRAKIGA